jgi:hypothetical protein
MEECGLDRKEWQMDRQPLQIVCLEIVAKLEGQDMGRECLRWEEWCKMLDTSGLCILAMCTARLSRLVAWTRMRHLFHRPVRSY